MRLALAPALALIILAAGCVSPAAVKPASIIPSAPSWGKTVSVGQDGNEPVLRVAPDGTIYIAALAYVWVSTDNGASFKQVDFKGQIPVYASDSALSVAPDGRVYVAFDWPYAGHTAVCSSADRGATWSCDAVAVPGATDRMWILAPTATDAYLITGQTLDRPTFAVSHDAGKTWSTTFFDPNEESQGADLAWDPTDHTIREAASADSGAWNIRSWDANGTFLGRSAVSDVRTDEPTLAIDSSGTWWANACVNKTGDCAPAVARSQDQGKTWHIDPIPAGGKTRLLPFIAAGAADHVAVAAYETDAASQTDASAEWRVAAITTSDGAHWTHAVITPDPVHKGAMCSAVNCLGDGRFAGDFLGLAIDSKGNDHLAWVKQTGTRALPATQVNPSKWVDIEYARTR